MSLKTTLYLATFISLGTLMLLEGLTEFQVGNAEYFLCYATLALTAGTLKVTLPTITGTMSVVFLFVLVGMVGSSLGETMLVGCIGTLLQCVWRTKQRPTLVQVGFNVANMSVAIYVAYFIYHLPFAMHVFDTQNPIRLLIAATVFFGINTGGVSGIVALVGKRSAVAVWKECYFWSFPYYLAGASLAWGLNRLNSLISWRASLLLLPVIYFVYRSYRMYMERLTAEKTHAEEMAGLHLRTIEALALAIEAKDYTTHHHLERVRVYAEAIGEELALSEPELNALRAAALLHDIGKLAVPENIISKPGKLTPEEFEKMKIHPIVGAEILERVQFPYPVVPIVRFHHERWDGSGYPAGLKGEEIPLGARILAAVDCLDALASDRQYRRALPLDEAMAVVSRQAGKAFDANVIAVLERRYLELEQLASSQCSPRTKLSKDLKVARGVAPAAGFESIRRVLSNRSDPLDYLTSIAAARQEAQLLYEITQDLGSSLSMGETLSVVALRLKKMIPYDAIAVFLQNGDFLVPEYVSGDDFRFLSSLRIPLGEGLSGWVANTRKPIVNGNPTVEAAFAVDFRGGTTMKSTLAVPLEGVNEPLGTLALYRSEKDAFTSDHMRIVLAIASKISRAVENALKYRQVESSATIDYLTGLPNARGLFLKLESEVARCERIHEPLAVLVCDLDGFKEVNDRFGHLEGNRVLQTVGAGLRDRCREYDFVARMGGDEFVILLAGIASDHIPERTLSFAKAATEAAQSLSTASHLSMSIGFACYPDDGTGPEALLAEADRRMYRQKESGKSRRQRVPWRETTECPEPVALAS